MVGGRSFSCRGRMFCGVNAAGLVVRVSQEHRDAVLAEPHVRPLVIGGRHPAGFVVVEPAGLETDELLAGWVERALAALDARDRARELPVGGRPPAAGGGATGDAEDAETGKRGRLIGDSLGGGGAPGGGGGEAGGRGG